MMGARKSRAKRRPTHWRRRVDWVRLGPDGAPADDGLTKLGVGRWEPADPSDEGAVATAERARIEREEHERHPIDLLLADARDVLRALDALAEADLEGPGAPALWDLAFKSSAPHAPYTLAARALCAAIRAREAIARGDAEGAARHAFFAAHHWVTRLQKRHEPERISGRQRRPGGAKGGHRRALNIAEVHAQILRDWSRERGSAKRKAEILGDRYDRAPKTIRNIVAAARHRKILPA
jgi:hypothetical protein